MKWCAEGYEDVDQSSMSFQWMAEATEAWAVQQVNTLITLLKTREAQLPEAINLLGGAMLRAGLNAISMTAQQSQAMRTEFNVQVNFDPDGTVRAKLERKTGIVAASEDDMKRILTAMDLKTASRN